MSYSIALRPAARRDLKALDKDVLDLIDKAILALSADPRAQGCSKLKGTDCSYRTRVNTRVGSYRILYDLDDASQSLIVLRVSHRRDAYR